MEERSAPIFALFAAAAGLVAATAHAQTPAAAPATDPVLAALTEGEVNFNLRLRYEQVDQDGFDEEADALTARLRLGYLTGPLYDLQGYVEFEHIESLGGEDYNSLLNSVLDRPVVADPSDTEVNQAYLLWTGLTDTRAVIGRQRIIYDNARFIGNVGWRQNEQTFNAASIVRNDLGPVDLSYAYLDKVNTITFGERDIQAHLVNLGVAAGDYGSLSIYGYLLDFDLDAGPTRDTQTYGARFAGGAPVAEQLKLVYALEYAHQQDYADAEADFDADYYLVEAGVEVAGVTVKAAQEQLGSGDNDDLRYSFQTPLATKHAFNGWADKFLGDFIGVDADGDGLLDGDGLVDSYLSLGTSLYGVNFLAVYHDFESDDGSVDYGSEFDVLLARKFLPWLSGLIKYADYNADEFATDTEKLWLQAEVIF